jgi:L-lactate dehydrogenase complex protein LldG
MSARDEVLERIRQALADRPAPPPVERRYARVHDHAQQDLVALLVDRLTDYRATVLRAGADDAAQILADQLAARGITALVTPGGVPPDLLSRLPSSTVRHGDDPPLSAEQLDRADGVITLSRLAVAETGTIVLDAGPGQGRRALSLVPDYHLCVVAADDVVRSVPDAIARLDSRRPLTWISGPSATSDIELQRVEGVHGPRTLDVLLIG